MKRVTTLQLVQGAMIAALAYVGFQFLRFDIPVGTERTAIHLGNTFVILGALLLGVWGGAAGALGLTMADLTSGYATSAPKTFILKLVMGLIAALVAKGLRKNGRPADAKGRAKVAAIAAIAALGCNLVLEPIFGYFYKAYIFGIPQDLSAALAKIGAAATLVNAVISSVIVAVLWPVLCAALIRAGAFPRDRS